MFKNIVLAILIAIVLTSCFGHISSQWLDWNLSIANDDLEPVIAILALTGVAIVLVVVGFIVAASIAGALLLAILAAAVGLFVVGITAFWPAIVFALVVFLLVKDKRTEAH